MELAGNKSIFPETKVYPTDIITVRSAKIALTETSHVFDPNKHIDIKIHHINNFKDEKLVEFKKFQSENNQRTLGRKRFKSGIEKDLFSFEK